ncbi:unnamed protein product [Closterium sp. NIES-65]|nr:unnamed protein product [Closterium sp. NIES-65]
MPRVRLAARAPYSLRALYYASSAARARSADNAPCPRCPAAPRALLRPVHPAARALPCPHCLAACGHALPAPRSLPAPTTPTEPAGEDVQRWYRVDNLAYRQWTERDAVAQLAARSLLPVDQRDYFRQVTLAQILFDTVVRHYSLSPATRPLQQWRPLLGEDQPLVEEGSVGTCRSARAGSATSVAGGYGGGQHFQQRQLDTLSLQ